RRAGVTPAITAVTQRMNDGFAFDLITDRAAVTAAGDVDHALLRSMQPCPLDCFGECFNAMDLPLRLTVARLRRLPDRVVDQRLAERPDRAGDLVAGGDDVVERLLDPVAV